MVPWVEGSLSSVHVFADVIAVEKRLLSRTLRTETAKVDLNGFAFEKAMF